MELQVLFASIAVADLARAIEWYERFFGRPCDIDINETEVMWRIGDGAWLYLIEDVPRAGKSRAAIALADLEQAVSELTERKIDAGHIKAEGDAALKSILIDPDGNSIELLEVNAPGGRGRGR